MKYILVFILSIQFSFAGQLTELQKDQPAPYTGVLVDSEQMKEFRQINEDKKRLETQNIKLKDLNDVNNLRIDFYKNEAKYYQTQIEKERTKAFWAKIGHFALGVIVTGLAAKVAIEASR